MENIENIICPITQEEIITYGFTCNGNIYEYDAIVNRLKNNYTDPLTNEVLPNKFIVKFEGKLSNNEIYSKRDDLRKNFRIWRPYSKNLENATIIIKTVNLLKKTINENKIDWDNYEKKIIEYFENKILEDSVLGKHSFCQINDNHNKEFINYTNNTNIKDLHHDFN